MASAGIRTLHQASEHLNWCPVCDLQKRFGRITCVYVSWTLYLAPFVRRPPPSTFSFHFIRQGQSQVLEMRQTAGCRAWCSCCGAALEIGIAVGKW